MFSYAFALATIALGAAAQQSATTSPPTTSAAGNAQTTITGLVGTYTSGFAASVVSADGCSTTLAMQCTDTDDSLCAVASDITLLVTQGPTGYEIVYSTATLGGEVTLSESCDLQGAASTATEMVCTASAMISADGTSTATSTTETLTKSQDFNYAQIPITAGASNLPSGSASCTSSDSGAAPTGITEIYKVIVPVGAAFMAGAAFM